MTDGGSIGKRLGLEKGGYRIGITAPSGAYFYYAHLDSYGSYQEGDEVKGRGYHWIYGKYRIWSGGDERDVCHASASGDFISIRNGEESQLQSLLDFKTCRGEKNFPVFLTMLYLNDMEDERMINLPNEFEEKMKALLGDEFEDYIKCYDEPRYYGLRVNTEKISVEDFVKICPFEITPIPWIDNGFLL